MTPEEEIVRAGRAREVLENELFKEAVREIETALLRGIQTSAFKDELLREKLCHRYSLLHDLVDQLKTYMETGQLGEATMAQKLRKVVGL